ncbi:MAG TPA: hypothetical protein VFL98_01140 [Candidatus Paceibacterota bacterium]|nr:hypothetical protein [Candidatus Paceibacterota bacterium]
MRFVYGFIVLVLALGAGLWWFLHRPAGLPAIIDLSVAQSAFVVHGTDLARVAIVAIPTGTGVSPDQYQDLGDASLVKGGTPQTWALPIPDEPQLYAQVYAEGYDDHGAVVGRAYLPQTGATAIAELLWPSSAAPAQTWFTVHDSGSSTTVKVTSRITVELPSAQYASSSLSIVPSGAMGETFGADAQPGDWVRTFETVSPGTATITVPPLDPSVTSPFTLIVNVIPDTD